MSSGTMRAAAVDDPAARVMPLENAAAAHQAITDRRAAPRPRPC